MRSISEIIECDFHDLSEEEFDALLAYKEERAAKRALQNADLSKKNAESETLLKTAQENHAKLMDSLAAYEPPVLKVVTYE